LQKISAVLKGVFAISSQTAASGGLEQPSSYDANFTAGGLLLDAFNRLEPVFLSADAETLLRSEGELNAYIGIKTAGARKRILTEVMRRGRVAPEGFWTWYYELPEREKALASLYLCMKTYRLVFDLHFDLALRKHRIGSELNAQHVEQFLDLLAGRDAYVGTFSEETMKKLNTQYRKALSDARLLDGTRLVQPVGIRADFWSFFLEKQEGWFLEACFQI
jgi:hypothetical protein